MIQRTSSAGVLSLVGWHKRRTRSTACGTKCKSASLVFVNRSSLLLISRNQTLEYTDICGLFSEQRDLQGLSNAAHFCCGTSKTLGAKRIWPKFEEIHNLGMLKDASGKADQPDIDKALEDIKFRLVDIDSDYKYLRDSFQRVYSSDEKDG